MIGFLLAVHVLACLLLVVVILMQSGRGGGLTESFSSAESVFGAKTNEFMIRVTVVLTTVFLLTSLSLAYLSARKEQSLLTADIKGKKAGRTVTIPMTLPEVPEAEAPDTTPPQPPAPVNQTAP